MDSLRHAVTDCDLTQVSKRLRQLRGQTDDVILTNGHNLHRKRILVVVGVVVDIMRDELLGCRIATWYDRLKELDKFTGLSLVGVEKVQALCGNKS